MSNFPIRLIGPERYSSIFSSCVLACLTLRSNSLEGVEEGMAVILNAIKDGDIKLASDELEDFKSNYNDFFDLLHELKPFLRPDT